MGNLKQVIVTGATGAIGKAIVKQLLSKGNYAVHFIARNQAKAENLVKEMKASIPGSTLDYSLVDLAHEDQIRNFAENWRSPLHVLINNAATAPRKRTENHNGIEMQFSINVLSYHILMDAFAPWLKKADGARIVNVASYWAGGLDLDDLEFRNRTYDNDAAYRQSKQADRMLSTAWAEVFHKYDISVNACHPGDVNSTLSNDLGFGGHESPDQGASTPVWLATDDAGIENTGKYFEHMRETPCRFSADRESVRKLYEICCQYESMT